MTPRRIGAIARLEFTTTVKRPLWWVLLVGVAFTVLSLSATTLLPQGDGRIGGPTPFANSEYALTAFFGLSGFVVYSFFASVLAGLAVIRDDEHRMSELLHSTPLTPWEYIAGKFCGVLGALLVVLGAQVAMLVMFYEVAGGAGTALGPFAAAHYVLPALAFGAVPIVVFASLAFAVGEWTRKPMVVYAIPVAIVFALPFFVTWSPPWLGVGANEALMVLDPSGMRWLIQRVIRVAPGVEFVNTNSVAFDRVFWSNRIGLLVVSLLVVVRSVPHTRRVIARGGAAAGGESPITRLRAAFSARSKPAPARAQPDPVTRTQLTSLGSLRMTRAVPGFARATWHMVRAELRELFSQPALYLFVPLLVGLSLDEGTSAYGPFGDALILTAGAMSVSMLDIMTFLICAVLLFFTVESVERERVTGFDAILYASPLRTSAILLAKNLSNAVLVVVLICVAALTTLPQLALQESGRVEVWPFVLVWGFVLVPTLVLWCAFATAVVAAVRERYTTYAICFSVLLVTLNSLQGGRITWLHNWTAGGALRWSDMGTFDLNGSALLLNRLFVLSLAGLFTGLAVLLFPRVTPDRTAFMRYLQPRAMLRRAVRSTPLIALPVLLGGVLAFKVQTGFQHKSALDEDKNYWRRNVEQWADFIPPSIAHVDLQLEVEPAVRHLAVRGSYLMFNATRAAITVLPFTVKPAFGEVDWTVGGSTASSENRSGLHLLTPVDAVMPGDSVRIGFEYGARFPDGFTRNGAGVSQFVLPSGVLLNNLRDSFLPTPGFVTGLGVTRDNSTEPAPVSEDFWKEEQRPLASPYTTRVEITAPPEYTMNSVGEKTGERIDGAGTPRARTTVTWESDHPVGVINVVGGRWDVVQDGSTKVFYHPGHDYNVDEILKALVGARTHYSEWFYPYPWRELRLSEYPNHDLNAMGFPTNIPFSEGLGFLSQRGADVPTAFVVTAHEAAHQWWGNVLAAGEGPGTGHLVEGMATYSALLLLEAELGASSRVKHWKQMEASYVQSREFESELPLARTVGDEGRSGRAVVFEKGALVQWMLQEHMGRQQMLDGLQAFIRYYVAEGSQPTLQHMLEFLRPYAPDSASYDAFVAQWFFDVVLPEFQVTEAAVRPVDAGWEVSATVENVGTGRTWVEVVAVGDDPADGELEAIELFPGTPVRLLFRVPFEPTQLIVDPDAQVLQSNRDAAVLDLEFAGRGGVSDP